MPIVSHILDTTTNNDGSQSCILRNYDQDGKEYMISFFAAAGVDINTIVNNRIAEMDEWLAQSEFETLVGAA